MKMSLKFSLKWIDGCQRLSFCVKEYEIKLRGGGNLYLVTSFAIKNRQIFVTLHGNLNSAFIFIQV